MPNDGEDNEKPLASLTESPKSDRTEQPESPIQAEKWHPSVEHGKQFVIVPESQQFKAPINLHPYTRPLTISDLESCVVLENSAFLDPQERATREKLAYRLSKCGELCLGIFCTVVASSGLQAETLATGRTVETGRKDGAVSVLLGQVIAAKTNDKVASDKSMGVPEDWQSLSPKSANIGHQEAGRTIVLHSVAVLPAFQGRGLGRVLMMAYMQQMNGAGIADRLALIAREKVGWYEKLGFSNKGKADVQFGGGGWIDMIFELKTLEPRAAYG